LTYILCQTVFVFRFLFAHRKLYQPVDLSALVPSGDAVREVRELFRSPDALASGWLMKRILALAAGAEEVRA